MTGVIKYFNLTARYGFILPRDGGKDVFFHESRLPKGCKVDTGQEVEYALYPFTLFPKEKPRALSVQLLSTRSYAPISEMRKAVAHGD
jgi:cold shock CspA family protein